MNGETWICGACGILTSVTHFYEGEDGTMRHRYPEKITCPKCGRTSWNPNDVREGYCGACHAFTSKRGGSP